MTNKQAKANVEPVRQRTQFSCMAASMAMCLRALDHVVVEDEVNRVMGARPMKGAAWEQALACAQHYGCRATLTMPATVEQLKAWTDAGIPIMIAWNPEGRAWSHASVVFDVDDDLNVYVADPNIPNPKETVRVVSETDFYSKWYEKFPDYLVRRPACAIEREVTATGQQIAPRTASEKAAWGSPVTRNRPSIHPPGEWQEVGTSHGGRVWEWRRAPAHLFFRIYENDDGDPSDPISQGMLYGLRVQDPDGQVWNYKTRTKYFGAIEQVAKDTVMWWLKGPPTSMADVFPRKGMYQKGYKMAADEGATMSRTAKRKGRGSQPTTPTREDKRRDQYKVRGKPRKQRSAPAQDLAEGHVSIRPGPHKNKGQQGKGTKGKGKGQRYPKHKGEARQATEQLSERFVRDFFKRAARADFKKWQALVPNSEIFGSKEQKALLNFWNFCQGELVEAVNLDDALEMVAWDMGWQGRRLAFAPGLEFLARIRRKNLRKEHEAGQRAAHQQDRDERRLGARGAAYSGNPDGKPIYPVEVDHGEHQALSGGHDVMKWLQDRYRIEQGNEPREPNPRLAVDRLVQRSAKGGARLDRGLRQKVNAKLVRVGLDGNGRFSKPEHAYSRAIEVLMEFGIEKDSIVSSHLFSARPSGTIRVDLAFTNTEDLFSPRSISNSILYLQFTELETNRFEGVAYLS